MQLPTELRQFYNQSIHPELMRLEKKRLRFFRYTALAILAVILIFAFAIYVDIFNISLLLLIPVVLLVRRQFLGLQNYVQTFKPRIITLLLDFIDNDVTFTQELRYIQEAAIAKETFLMSKLFNSVAPDYIGEDYIVGKMGELDFEMSELSVKEMSPVRNRLDDVFQGVFLHALFGRPIFKVKEHEDGMPRPEILILPKTKKTYLSKTIKAFTIGFAKPIEGRLKGTPFLETFVVYANESADADDFISPEMQARILDYRSRMDKEIYLSFIASDVFIAIEQPKDLLEPSIFRSSVSFDLIAEYYLDLQLLFAIVLDIDACH